MENQRRKGSLFQANWIGIFTWVYEQADYICLPLSLSRLRKKKTRNGPYHFSIFLDLNVMDGRKHDINRQVHLHLATHRAITGLPLSAV